MFNKKLIKIIGSCLFLLILCFGLASYAYAEDMGSVKDVQDNTNIFIGPKTPGGLKEAIKIAKPNATIYLKNGIYTGKNNRGITINKDINIEGLGSKVTINAQGKNRIFNIKTGDVSIKKLKMINGNAPGKNKWGGAIYSKGAFLSVKNCIFSGNKATDGGAIYYFNNKGHMIANNCTFTKNQVGIFGSGGAIICENSTITKCIFKNNKAKSNGGAISSSQSTIKQSIFTNNQAPHGGAIDGWENQVNNCKFTNNKATRYGGAINGWKNQVNNCKFTNNQATMCGGAIYDSDLNINGCKFVNNQAQNGGAIYGVVCEVNNSIFTNNKAKQNGGAINVIGEVVMIIHDLNSKDSSFSIYNRDVEAIKDEPLPIYRNSNVTNSIFSKNQAGRNGGAIYSKSNSTIEKSTFDKNKAKLNGGAIYNKAKSLNISNSKFTNNIAAKIYNAIFSKSTVTINNVKITPKEGQKLKK